MSKEVVTQFDLDDFSWDNESSPEVIISPSAETNVQDEPENISDNVENPEEEDKGKIVKTKVVTLNENGELEEKEEETQDNSKQEGKETKKDDPETGSIPRNLQLLRETGVIDFEDDEIQEEDFDEEEFIERKTSEKVDNKLNDLLSKLPEGLKNMIRFASKGGDYMEVVKDLATPRELSSDLDISEVENQKRVIEYFLKNEGKTSDEIEEYIEFLEAKGKLENLASIKYDQFLEEEETREERRLEEHKKAVQERTEKLEKNKKEISDFLSTKPKLFETFSFNRTEVKELPSYMNDPSVELEDGRVTTKFNYDLLQALQNREKSLLLAKIIKSDFDMKDFVKNIENKVINNVEKGQPSVVTKIGSSQNKEKQHLVDFL